MEKAVSVKNIRKSFGKVEAVRDVSFEVAPGEIFGMLGPNGAGKTTSIRIMLDIFKANRGEVTILGGEINAEKKNRIGYLPEERASSSRSSTMCCMRTACCSICCSGRSQLARQGSSACRRFSM